MIQGKKLDHIGLAVTDLAASSAWYQEVLGFRLIGSFHSGDTPVHFLQSGDTVYEMYQQDLPESLQGKVDHIAYTSQDIATDFAECKALGYKITTDGIQCIPTFWENGCRFFKIASPTGEQVEFCQKV